MCWIRRVVDNTLHWTHNESIWETGIITCLAWPCSLTQMIEEMDEYEAPISSSRSHDDDHNQSYDEEI